MNPGRRSTATRPRQAPMPFAPVQTKGKPNAAENPEVGRRETADGAQADREDTRVETATGLDTGQSIAGNPKLDAVRGASVPGRDAAIASAIGIFETDLGTKHYRWLCAAHVASRKASGWSVKRIGDVDQDCDDCRHAAQPSSDHMRFPVPVRAASVGEKADEET